MSDCFDIWNALACTQDTGPKPYLEQLRRKAEGLQHGPWLIAGAMCGTSADGLDVVLARIDWNELDCLRILSIQHESYPISGALKATVLRAQDPTASMTARDFAALHQQIGQWYADGVLTSLRKWNTASGKLCSIGIHGMTLAHQPPDSQRPASGWSWQLGEAAWLAQEVDCPVISDFRPADVAAGGQGAPLVSFADLLIFQHETEGRCIQNLGGIGNVTALPPLEGGYSEYSPFAFDTGPANMLMDLAMQYWFDAPYDENGNQARRGRLHPSLLEALQAEAYYAIAPPKSTGREAFGAAYFEHWRERYPSLSGEAFVRTFCELTAWSIAEAYHRFVSPHWPISEVILGGGGAQNPFLVERIQSQLKAHGIQARVKNHSDYAIPNQAKEGLAFALLAWTHELGLPNSIPTCTGATYPVILGKRSAPRSRF